MEKIPAKVERPRENEEGGKLGRESEEQWKNI